MLVFLNLGSLSELSGEPGSFGSYNLGDESWAGLYSKSSIRHFDGQLGLKPTTMGLFPYLRDENGHGR